MLVDEHSWPEWVTFSTTATTGRCPWLACVAAPTVYCLFIRTFSSFICHPISSQNEPLQAVWVLDHSDTRRPPCWGGSCGTVSVDHLGRLENLVCVTSWCGRWAKPVDVAAGTEKKTKPHMCLTTSPEYLYSPYWYDSCMSTLHSPGSDITVCATRTKCTFAFASDSCLEICLFV